jgi:hypothetical protein
MVVDPAYVYWTDGKSKVQRVAIAGGAVIDLAVGQAKPWGIATDQAYVYWSANLGSAIMRTLKDGSGTPELVAATPTASPGDIALDAANVYWVNQTNPPSNTGRNVWMAPKSGGMGTLAKTIQNGNFVTDMVSNSTDIWVSTFGGDIAAVKGTMVALNFGARHIAVDSTRVYATSNRCGLNWFDELTGAAPGAIDLSPSCSLGPRPLTANSCGVFFSGDEAPGSPPTPIDVRLIHPGQRFPVLLLDMAVAPATVDNRYLYFSSGTAVGKVPLP